MTRVGHCKRDRCDVYIGRGSRWGNPFVFPGMARRSKYEVIEVEDPLTAYEQHVRSTPDLVAALPQLAGKVLGCWCVQLDEPDEPERCHGHVLQRLVREVCGGG